MKLEKVPADMPFMDLLDGEGRAMMGHVPAPIRKPEQAPEGLWRLNDFRIANHHRFREINLSHLLKRAFFYYDWNFEFVDPSKFEFNQDSVQINGVVPQTLRMFRQRFEKSLNTDPCPDTNMAAHEDISDRFNAVTCSKRCSAACVHSLYESDQDGDYTQFFMGNLRYQMQALLQGLSHMGLDEASRALYDLFHWQVIEPLDDMGTECDDVIKFFNGRQLLLSNFYKNISGQGAQYAAVVKRRNERAVQVREIIVEPILEIIDSIMA